MLRALKNRLKQSMLVQTTYRRYVQPHMPQYEQETYILKNMKFDQCVDVGAHAGTYSILLSRRANHVFAFEPSKHSFDILQNLRLPNVTAFNVALSNENGEAEMSFPRLGGDIDYALATLRTLRTNEYESVDVEKVQLSQFNDFGTQINFNRIDFVKIDVEGFEMNVLLGMDRLIARRKAALLIEIEQRHNPNCREVFEYLGARGYEAYYTLEGAVLRKLDIDILPSLQTKEKLIRDSARKFRGGEPREYILNFFFLQPEHKSRFLIAG
ncbi:MAG: FkbM family methyltransferase [Methylovirgula sp.]|uniref:FkbM family methyltransferase n=1 Tax=Methylovirgula sp. TaxID=1978224 RepID=UPI00307628BC